MAFSRPDRRRDAALRLVQWTGPRDTSAGGFTFCGSGLTYRANWFHFETLGYQPEAGLQGRRNGFTLV